MSTQVQSPAVPVKRAASTEETPDLRSRIVSACTGAVLTSLLMTPFDVVKTRQQSQTLFRADPLIPAVQEWRAAHYWVPRNARQLVDSALYTYLREQGNAAPYNTMRPDKLRTNASLCLCMDPMPGRSSSGILGKNGGFFSTNVGGKNTAAIEGSRNRVTAAWHELYQDLIAPQRAAQSRLWPQSLPYSVSTIASGAADERIKGTVAGMRHIARTEGLATLWRGLSPTLVASGPSTVIYFVGYDYLRQWIGKKMMAHNSLASYEKYSSLVAGCAARTAAVTAISPIELVRTRMQASATHDFSTVMQGISAGIRKDGLGSLWRGLVPTLWRDVPFSAIYWFGYERWREEVYEPLFKYNGQNADVLSRMAVAFCSGASSGTVAAALTIPFDVAKTRRQIEQHANPKSNIVQHNSLAQIIRHIVSTEGTRGLFTGLTPRLMKVAPSCAIMISSYELGKMLLLSPSSSR
ncbi:Carrier protein, mitochondrial [Coemansia sp. RSA 2559]|nr:Carrier protein, mitochondrial [Coemansia sp. RSA 2559]KAJ2868842.1 Carrier protein, mitochondrial [Coemansia erecta]